MKLRELPKLLENILGHGGVSYEGFSNPLNHKDDGVQYIYPNGDMYSPLVTNAEAIAFPDPFCSSFFDLECVGLYPSKHYRNMLLIAIVKDGDKLDRSMPIFVSSKGISLKGLAEKLGIDWYYVRYLNYIKRDYIKVGSFRQAMQSQAPRGKLLEMEE